jgi:hypothetical protein
VEFDFLVGLASRIFLPAELFGSQARGDAPDAVTVQFLFSGFDYLA